MAIAGLGGVGGIELECLARTGFGKFNLADFDRFEIENINRQHGARVNTIGAAKLETAASDVLSINPHLDIREFGLGVTAECVESFLDDVDVVIDALDFFAIDAKQLLYREAHRRGLFCVSAGPIGYGCSLLVFAPEPAMSAEAFFRFSEAPSDAERAILFGVGLTPWLGIIRDMDQEYVDVNRQRGPSLALACALCAGLATAECVRIVLGRPGIKPVPYVRRFDAYRGRSYTAQLRWGNAGPIQRLKVAYGKRRYGGRRWPTACVQAALPKLRTSTRPDARLIRALCEYGALAPSADNAQHSYFNWTGESLEVWQDGQRSDFFGSAAGEPLLLAYGAVVENIAIAASTCGLLTNVSFLFDHKELGNLQDVLVARLSFGAADLPSDALVDFIADRRTLRLDYQKRPMSPTSRARLVSSVPTMPECRLHIFDAEETLPTLGRAVRQGDRILWEHQRMHADLFRWLRLSDDEPDGLPISSLGLAWYERFVFPLLRKWEVVRTLNWCGLSRLTSGVSYRWMKNSAAHCVISTDKRCARTFFLCGRYMERFWLQASALGLAVQPMTASVVLLNRFAYNGGTDFSGKHLQMVQEIKEVYDSLLGRDRVPVMTFRVGYCTEKQGRSRRRPVDAILNSRADTTAQDK